MRDGVSPGLWRGVAYALALYAMGGAFVALFAAGVWLW